MVGKENFDLIVRARDEASARLSGITKNIGLMVGAAVGVGAIGRFLRDSTNAAIEAEKVWNDLSASVQRHGGSWDEVGGALEAFASKMQSATGLSDEAVARSTQVFIDYGSNARRSMELVKVAADLAAGANMSLESATGLVAKASVGYTATLSRYGIIIDESIPKSEKFAAAIEQINQRFGGAAAARMSTTAQQMEKLSQQIDDFQENIGRLTAGPLTGMVEQMNNLLTVVNSSIPRWEKFQTVMSWFSIGATGFGGVSRAMAETALKVAEIDAENQKAIDSTKDFTNNMAGLGDEVKKTERELLEFIESVRKGQQAADAAAPGPEILAKYDSFRVTMERNGQVVMKFNNQIAEQDALLGNIPDIAIKASEQIRILTKEEEKLIKKAREDWQAFQASFESATAEGLYNVAGLFTGARKDIGDVFEGILADFANMLARMAAQRIAASIFGGIFGGGGLTAAGASQGIIPDVIPIIGPLFRPDSGAPGVGSLGRPSVVVNINGPILGEEQHVRKVVIPAIERAVDVGATRIAVRGRG